MKLSKGIDPNIDMAQIIIEVDEYDKLKEMQKAFTQNRLYIQNDSYFSGGPGGVVNNAIIVYSKESIGEFKILKDLKDEINSLSSKLAEKQIEILDLRARLKKKNWF